MCHVPDASALSLRRLWQSAQLLSLMRVAVAVALGCARRLNSRLCGCTVAQEVVHFPCACGAITPKFHFRKVIERGLQHSDAFSAMYFGLHPTCSRTCG